MIFKKKYTLLVSEKHKYCYHLENVQKSNTGKGLFALLVLVALITLKQIFLSYFV